MKLTYSILTVCLAAISSATAGNVLNAANRELTHYQQSPKRLQQVISQAISDFEQTPHMHWSFRISRYENEEGDITSSIEKYDPVSEEGHEWSLLRLNGELPSEKAQQKFAKAKRERLQENGEHSYSIKLSEIIQTDSLTFFAEDEKSLQATFRVYLSQLGEDTREKLLGTLSYNKQHAFIENIEIVNTEAFSPMFSAKITNLRLTFSFFKIDDAILLHQQALNMKGTFAFFTDIDEESLDTYSDYQIRSD